MRLVFHEACAFGEIARAASGLVSEFAFLLGEFGLDFDGLLGTKGLGGFDETDVVLEILARFGQLECALVAHALLVKEFFAARFDFLDSLDGTQRQFHACSVVLQRSVSLLDKVEGGVLNKCSKSKKASEKALVD